MNEKTYSTLLNALTHYDKLQSKRKHYNHYALGHYCGALQRVRQYVELGHDLRSAIITCFSGRLCDRLLKASGLEKMTRNEAQCGLWPKLPQLPDYDL